MVQVMGAVTGILLTSAAALLLAGCGASEPLKPDRFYSLEPVPLEDTAEAPAPAILLVNEPPTEVNGRGMSTVGLLKELKNKTDITVVFMTTDHRLGQEAEKVYRVKDGKLETGANGP